jgi:hypothetical protein
MSLRRITAGFGAILFFPCLAFASEPPAEALLARQLLEIPELKETIVSSLLREVAPGTGAELARATAMDDERIWKALEEELPSFLGARMPRERIQELARSYGENPLQAWGASGAEMAALAVDLSKVDNRFSRALMRSACSAGILAPNIDRAKEKAGKSNPFKATPQAMEALQPILQRLDETCGCLLEQWGKAFGERLFTRQVPKDEQREVTKKIFENRQCPDPFENLTF